MQLSVKEIQKAVASLSPQELARFRRWFEAFDAQRWDEQIEDDARKGKLHKIAEQALKDYEAGNVQEL